MIQEFTDFLTWLRINDYCRLNIDKFIRMDGSLTDKYKILFIEFKKENMKDTIVESVINQFKERSSVGINKYGVTLDRTDLSTLQWMIHFREELMDGLLYLERVIQDTEKLKQYEK
jgi:hypothetical protein